MRHLHVTQPTTEGTAAVVRALAEMAVRAGHHVTIASPQLGELGSGDNDGIAWSKIDITRPPRVREVKEILKIRALCRSMDVVHVHSTKAGLLTRIALLSIRKDNRPRVLFFPHGWSWHAFSGLARQVCVLMERLLARACDVIVCVSAGEMRDGERVLGERSALTVLQNSVDERMFIPGSRDRVASDTQLNLLCVGRLCYQKGQDRLLAAMRLVKATDIVLRFVGDGPDEFYLRSLANSADRAGLDIQFIGKAAALPYMQAADMLVMPSRYEGMSLVMLEALSCGLPIVCGEVSGAEIVAEAGGIVVEQSSDVDFARDFAHAIDKLAVDPERRQRIGAQGRTLILARHSLRQWRLQYERLLSA